MRSFLHLLRYLKMNSMVSTLILYGLVFAVGGIGVVMIEVLPQYLFSLDLVYGNY